MHAVGASHTPRDWHLYRGAVVRIRFEDQSVLVEPRPPGTTEGAFPAAVGDAAVHVITAWNPLGRITPDDVTPVPSNACWTRSAVSATPGGPRWAVTRAARTRRRASPSSA
ncbi:hypothetical protein ABTX34_21535 [Streptomyces sp. NPDC096538]|uniref:hypothetical protein n=1 Tax=Streptomyces sp. NPDC096538 TaxID=3155427 RepID=UPI003323E123